ncbi:MAG: hypothetical protein ABI365_01745, partial [Lysobacteraceae bacterium]
KHGLDHFDGADRMAAGAYQVGRYALAAQLAAKSTAPMAAWVRAKLALRAGDQATAMREYAAAAKGFPIDERWGEDASDSGAVQSPVCRVESERGVLALSRGEYVDAMARLYAGSADYWPDAAYVAERVLTADELKNFVDRNAPIAPKLVRSEIDGGTPIPPGTQLRALLARRLLRVGRDDEAMRYFDDPALHAKAAALVAARHPGMTWTNIGRAKNLFKQAQLTRADGLELLGTELAPDYAMEDGEYALGNVPLQPKDFVGTGEPVRVNASAPAPDARYHYRYVAADLAEQAAALIPVRSQAYAALMCQATAWMSDTEEKRAASLYRRYLHEGAWVAWGKDFGRSCPPPDFASARWVPLKQHYRALRHWTKHGWPLLLGGLGLLVILVAAIRNRRGRSDAE